MKSNFGCFYFLAAPDDRIPTIDKCNLTSSIETNGTSCVIESSIALKIACTVNGYYPDITLDVYHDSTKMDTVENDEWENEDGTKRKRIVVMAVPSYTYTCVASNIPGSEKDDSFSVQITVLRESTTQTVMETKSLKWDESTKSRKSIGKILCAGILVCGARAQQECKSMGCFRFMTPFFLTL